jgi:hypothetical protein
MRGIIRKLYHIKKAMIERSETQLPYRKVYEKDRGIT